jgi:hypothetical protein
MFMQTIDPTTINQNQAVATPAIVTPHEQPLFHYTGIAILIWNKLAIILLLLHGVQGLWESIKFLFWEYPELSHLLETKALTQQEINSVILNAGIMLAITFITLAMAVRLHKVHESLAHTLDLVLGTILIVLAAILKNQLSSLDIMGWIVSLI